MIFKSITKIHFYQELGSLKELPVSFWAEIDPELGASELAPTAAACPFDSEAGVAVRLTPKNGAAWATAEWPFDVPAGCPANATVLAGLP